MNVETTAPSSFEKSEGELALRVRRQSHHIMLFSNIWSRYSQGSAIATSPKLVLNLDLSAFNEEKQRKKTHRGRIISASSCLHHQTPTFAFGQDRQTEKSGCVVPPSLGGLIYMYDMICSDLVDLMWNMICSYCLSRLFLRDMVMNLLVFSMEGTDTVIFFHIF